MTTKKPFFPQDTKTLLIFTFGGWFVTYLIDRFQIAEGIPTIIGGVAAFAFLGGLIGLLIKGVKKLFGKS